MHIQMLRERATSVKQRARVKETVGDRLRKLLMAIEHVMGIS